MNILVVTLGSRREVRDALNKCLADGENVVQICHTFREAVDELQCATYDALLTDCMLPEAEVGQGIYGMVLPLLAAQHGVRYAAVVGDRKTPNLGQCVAVVDPFCALREVDAFGTCMCINNMKCMFVADVPYFYARLEWGVILERLLISMEERPQTARR